MRSKGFILFTKQINDWDKFLYIITKDGVFPYIINRGYHYSSPLLSLFNTYDSVDFYWEYGKLQELRIIYDYDQIHSFDIKIIYNEAKRALFYELIRSYMGLTNIYFVKDEYELFKNIIEYLRFVPNENIKGIYFSFILKMLINQGLYPQLNQCVLCGKSVENSVYFSIKEGGFICKNCLKGKNIKVYKVTERFKKVLIYYKNHPEKLFERYDFHLDILKNFDIIKWYYDYHFKETK